MSVAEPRVPVQTVAELLHRLGSVAPERVCFSPIPGTATEADVLELHDRFNRLFELVEGVLVEKAMGFYESRVAIVLLHYIEAYLKQHDLGVAVGADGFLRLAPGLVRIPDAAFLSWARFPGRKLPRDPIPSLAPDLAVEVISRSNTVAEMTRKLREYFRAGTRLVWYVDPELRQVTAYTSPTRRTVLRQDDVLSGGRVLPGFKLSIRAWFQQAGERRAE